jgi:hypothetical protein
MTITLQNIGQSAIDFLLPTFVENPINVASNNQRNSREDTYEQDMYAANTHAFIWPINEDKEAVKATGGEMRVHIKPGEEHELVIGLFGKRNW